MTARPGEVMKSGLCATCGQRRAVVGWSPGAQGCGCGVVALVLAPLTMGLGLLLLVLVPILWFAPVQWRCTACGSKKGITAIE